MKRAISIILACGVSVFFVWLSLRGRNVDEILHAVRHADPRWMLFYFAFLFGVHIVRTIRWGVLIEPVAKVSFFELNMLSSIGFMLLMILPLRLGEFGRPFLVAEHCKVSKSASLASVVFERIVDGLTMGALLVLLIWICLDRGVDAQKAAVLRVQARRS